MFGAVRQLGYVVESLDAAVEAWMRGMRVGPWTIMRNVPLHAVYEGKPSVPVIDLALSYRGDVQIELIQQTNDAPSPYRDPIARKQFGLHHIAFLSDEINDAVKRGEDAGLKLVFDINMNGGRYVYFASPVPGERTFIEVLQATPQIRQMFEIGVPAARGWNGSGKPVVIDFATLKR
ncbi:MAG TPA: VOC family protein [Nevskiaceae bacterium]|nr:VOC family protein [Nevskiaceae bacterium]